MTSAFRCIALLALGLVLQSCASRPAFEYLTRDGPPAEEVEDVFTQQPKRQATVRRAPQQAKGAATAGNDATGRTTGSVASAAAPYTPEWYEKDKAEADRLKSLTNICRC